MHYYRNVDTCRQIISYGRLYKSDRNIFLFLFLLLFETDISSTSDAILKKKEKKKKLINK